MMVYWRDAKRMADGQSGLSPFRACLPRVGEGPSASCSDVGCSCCDAEPQRCAALRVGNNPKKHTERTSHNLPFLPPLFSLAKVQHTSVQPPALQRDAVGGPFGCALLDPDVASRCMTNTSAVPKTKTETASYSTLCQPSVLSHPASGVSWTEA